MMEKIGGAISVVILVVLAILLWRWGVWQGIWAWLESELANGKSRPGV